MRTRTQRGASCWICGSVAPLPHMPGCLNGRLEDRATPDPGPERADWIDFLYWLAEHEAYTAREIIDVVEEPWHYASEYAEYLSKGGVRR